MSRRAVSVSSFIAMSLRRLHHHHHRLTTFSPSAAHSFSTGGPFNFNGDQTQNSSDSRVRVKKPDEEKLVNDLWCIRADVPGLSSEDLNLWVDENKNIRYKGKCKNEPKYREEGKVYEGFIKGLSSLLEIDEVKAELKHGVLWISLPLNEEGKRLRRENLGNS